MKFLLALLFAASSLCAAQKPTGSCEVKVLVPGAAEVTVQGSHIDVRTVSGAEAHDASTGGSRCEPPLPDRDFEGFRLEVKQKHGDVQLSQTPSRSDGYRAVVFLRNTGPGPSLFVFRLRWTPPPPAPPPGMSMNNTVHSQGRGRGEARLDDHPPLALTGATVDFDNGGKLFVVMPAEHGPPVSFGGSVMSFEGGVMKADVAAGEQFQGLRGPMYLYFDGKRQIYKIDLQATDGQQHLRVTWERK